MSSCWISSDCNVTSCCARRIKSGTCDVLWYGLLLLSRSQRCLCCGLTRARACSSWCKWDTVNFPSVSFVLCYLCVPLFSALFCCCFQQCTHFHSYFIHTTLPNSVTKVYTCELEKSKLQSSPVPDNIVMCCTLEQISKSKNKIQIVLQQEEI